MIVVALVIAWLTSILCLVLSPFFIGLNVLRVPREYAAKRSDRLRKIYISDFAALTFVMALFMAPYRRLLTNPLFFGRPHSSAAVTLVHELYRLA